MRHDFHNPQSSPDSQIRSHIILEGFHDQKLLSKTFIIPLSHIKAYAQRLSLLSAFRRYDSRYLSHKRSSSAFIQASHTHGPPLGAWLLSLVTSRLIFCFPAFLNWHRISFHGTHSTYKDAWSWLHGRDFTNDSIAFYFGAKQRRIGCNRCIGLGAFHVHSSMNGEKVSESCVP